jgi:hypothetical protein
MIQTDYSVTHRANVAHVEKIRLAAGWSCVFRTGIDPDGTNTGEPLVLLHVWHKITKEIPCSKS